MTETTTTEFRANLSRYKEMVADHPTETIAVKDRNATAFMVVSPEYLEGLEATVDLLADAEAMQALADSDKDIRAGRVVSHEKVRKLVGLE